MENASKALIMAVSVLIALMVIALVSVTYNKIVEIKRTEADVEKDLKTVSNAKMFEEYNRTIYGSELLSLANLLVSYNERQVGMKGYNPITINVDITKKIKEYSKTYLANKKQSISESKQGISGLEDDIADLEEKNYKNTLENKERSVKYYAQLNNRQIATLFKIAFSSDETDYDIGDRLENQIGFINAKVPNLMKDIEKYKNLKTTYTEFKNTYFTCEEVKYDSNGIISEMYFVEK